MNMNYYSYKQYKKFINKKLSTEDTNMADVILSSIFLSLNVSFMSKYQELSLGQSLSLPMNAVLWTALKTEILKLQAI